MTPNSSIPVSLLYNERLLRCLLGKRIDGRDGLSPDGEALATPSAYRLYAQREFQVSFQRQDNAIFSSRWQYFCQEYPWRDDTGPVLSALRSIYDEYMEERDNTQHVRLERFGEWQNLLANICYQPLAAYAAQRHHGYSRKLLSRKVRDREEEALFRSIVHASPLCHPYEIAVEDYIRDKGLNDAHLHINACSYTEYSWVYALRHPHKAFSEIIKKRKEEALQQQFIEIYDVPPARILLRHLLIARNLRTILRNHAESTPTYTPHMYSGPALSFISCGLLPMASVESLADVMVEPIYEDADWDREGNTGVIRQERAWMSLLLYDLLSPDNHGHKVWLIRLFHVYLLLMNEYCNLFSQKESQKGFSQFSNTQQIPQALSEHPKYYYECLMQFHGARTDSDVHYLDARIAAKTNPKRNHTQILRILRAYYRYLQWSRDTGSYPGRSFRDAYLGHLRPGELIDAIKNQVTHSRHRVIHMNLTAHFIKKPWTWTEGDSYRYHSFRKELETCCGALAANFRKIRGLSRIFNAVDAANDEQYVPPSVFAPCFRRCRHELHMENFTFHCGEDFPHLLTGIRVLNDAMLCLDLRQGDRIGHGTAIGMSPKHWRRSVPRILYVKKEDRMLDLLFAHRILKLRPDVPTKVIRHMHDEMLGIAHELFDNHVPSVDIMNLQMAMELRKLSPELLLDIFGHDSACHMDNICSFKEAPDAYIQKHFAEYNERKHEHRVTCSCLQQSSPYAIKIILAWFTQKSIWQEGSKLMPVDIRKEHDELYCTLQQHIMKEFYDRRIIVETLMSSNLRIACYGQAAEHHSMRWLLRQPEPFCKDPKVLLAFGTDDPAIFSCDAKSEFYLLYASLREHGVTENDAINLLDEVNNRGRIYSFLNTNAHSLP